jgi:hypothetical protein
MRLWVHAALGRDYVHTGRTAHLAPDLHLESAHVLDVLLLHVHPDSLDEMRPWRKQQLLSYLATMDVSGPWAQLAQHPEELASLRIIIRHAELFLPASLWDLLGTRVRRQGLLRCTLSTVPVNFSCDAAVVLSCTTS